MFLKRQMDDGHGLKEEEQIELIEVKGNEERVRDTKLQNQKYNLTDS